MRIKLTYVKRHDATGSQHAPCSGFAKYTQLSHSSPTPSWSSSRDDDAKLGQLPSTQTQTHARAWPSAGSQGTTGTQGGETALHVAHVSEGVVVVIFLVEVVNMGAVVALIANAIAVAVQLSDRRHIPAAAERAVIQARIKQLYQQQRRENNGDSNSDSSMACAALAVH